MILNGLPWKRTEVIVIFETALKYCISDSFVDYDGYSKEEQYFQEPGMLGPSMNQGKL